MLENILENVIKMCGNDEHLGAHKMRFPNQPLPVANLEAILILYYICNVLNNTHTHTLLHFKWKWSSFFES